MYIYIHVHVHCICIHVAIHVGFLGYRYSREESFTALNIDIRNQQHLFESLDAFVKGDLLEGANAYHCEKCDKKVRPLTTASGTYCWCECV